MSIQLFHGDCLEQFLNVPDKSVDLVLTDPPYGTTACKWDSVIPFEPMWKQVWRVLKLNGAAVFTASQPFTSALVMSQIEAFKYCWVWDKVSVCNPQLAKHQPLKHHEDVAVFAQGKAAYYPQGLTPCKKERKADTSNLGHCVRKDYVQTATGYPKAIVKISSERGLHPTQKPVALMEYFIKTYSNEGGTVLDFTMGSGTTGVAAKNLNRSFIGIERDEKYFQIAQERILGTQPYLLP
jgi:site-specific DNA-methyltransferase (adenine-specific)